MSSDFASGRSERRGWLAIAVFLLLYAVAYLDRQVINLLVDPIREGIGASDFQVSLLQGAAFVLFFVTCGLPIGWAADRYPRRWIIFIGMIVWSFTASLAGLAQTFWQLFAARAGVGAGEAALAPSVYSMLADIFPKERLAFAMAVFSCGAIVGGALSLAAGGAVVGLMQAVGGLDVPLIGHLAPWQAVFFVTGLPGLALAFLVFLVTEPPRTAPPPKAAPDLSFFTRHWRFYVCHFVGFSLLGAVAAGFQAWAPSLFIRTLGWSVAQVGAVKGAAQLVGGLTGMLASGFLADHLLRRGMKDAHLRIYIWSAFAVMATGVTIGLAKGVAVLVVGSAMVHMFLSFIAVAASALQIVTPSRSRGQASAMFLFAYNVTAYAFGPMLIAAATDFVFKDDRLVGHSIALAFGVVCPLAALSFFLGLKAMRKAVTDAEGRA